MMLYAVETLRANGKFLFDRAYVHLFDAVDDAEEGAPDDACCEENVSDDDYLGPCPGGCADRTPRIVLLEVTRSDTPAEGNSP